MAHIIESQFSDRLVSLVLAGRELPKKHLDRHIVLIGACLKVELDRLYSEQEINEALQLWAIHFGRAFGLDHVTLRRYLIDDQYLVRDSAGGTYKLAAGGLPYTFDDSICQLDLEQLVTEAKQARELKKTAVSEPEAKVIGPIPCNRYLCLIWL
jgi:hypothetical protein